MSSKWDKHLDTIRSHAGTLSTDEIAQKIGATPNIVYQICHRNDISLKRKKYIGRKTDIEAAKNLLIENGYRVLLPDPFIRPVSKHGRSA